MPPAQPEPEPEPPSVELTNACVLVSIQLVAAIDREAWDEVEQLFAPYISVEGRRKIVGFPRIDLPSSQWPHEMRRYLRTGMVRHVHAAVAVRGERLALIRVELGTADLSSGAPQDEMLQVVGLDEEGRIALQVWFDIEDVDAAIAELDAQHARFEKEQPKARRLENAASRADGRVNELFADRRWDEFDTLFADDLQVDDRRRGVRRQGSDRATELANARAIADIGVKTMTSHVLAIRGERVALVRTVCSGRDQRPEAFHTELLRLAEIDTGGSIVAMISFDLDDVDAAYEELEARYLAGEAAPYAHVWQIGMETLGELNRHEPGRMIAGLVYTDHRRIPFAPGDSGRAVEELWALVPDARYRTPEVYALDAHGLVVKFVIEGTDIHGSELQWPRVLLLSVGREETRLEVYEEDDVDAALARFEELRPQARRFENAASQAVERYSAHFAARDRDALAKVLADDISIDDRRRVVNSGIRHGRDAEIANLRAVADAGITYFTPVVIATRGERLILAPTSGGDNGPEEFVNDLLAVLEINSHNQIAAIVMFELDDFDAAIAELDARYLAGEAAAHGNVLQPVMDTVGELNRHEPGPMLGRLAFADHRRVPFGSGEDYGRAIEELWTLVPDARYWTKAVHALDAHGLVSTLVIEGADAHGNKLQWGRTFLFLSDGLRTEVYEEDDVDAALARFEELRPQARRLANAASKVTERYMAHFAARDWDALAQVLADDISVDDRRRVVNAGIKHGRDAEIANLRAAADVGITYFTAVVIAARGERLILAHVSGGEGGSGEFLNEVLGVVEINSDNQVAAIVLFELDDFDAAITELDARYLAGEAAAHARTWSVITQGHAALGRNQLPPLTPDCVSIDHRRGTSFAPGELTAYFRAGFDLDQNIRSYVEVVHRLSDLGGVCTHAAHGVSKEGFEAEWRDVDLLMVEGDMVNHCEVFREADLDAALARFDQLSRPATRLENTASQVYDRVNAYFSAGDWAALSKVLAQNMIDDDRRRTVNHGIRRGRDAEIANSQAVAEAGADQLTSTVIATRGGRLALCRSSIFGRDQQPEAFCIEFLSVVEIDADEQEVAHVAFDLDDFEAAIAELDARYLAGEAAAHAGAWSVIAGAFDAHNRREVAATTPDAVSIDHRRVAAYAPGQGIEYIRAGWDLGQNVRTYIEAVHRLNNLGAIVTYAAHGTSQEGFDAEWRGVQILTVEGDVINRSELFDEEDLDGAFTRFDQLSRPAPRLENAASQAAERLRRCFAARDWDGLAEILTEDILADDRRRIVGTGIRCGREANVADIRAGAEVGAEDITSTVIATRGERIVLDRALFSSSDQQPEALNSELLRIVEIDTDNRMTCCLMFDLDDVDAAFAELDARYLAGEAAAHARTWSVIAGIYAAFNRRELPAMDWVTVDHRRGTPFASSDLITSIRTSLDLTPDLSIRIEAVHRLSNFGAVLTNTSYGTSQEGFDAEWRMIHVLTVEGERINRLELFDEADIDAAIARFEALHPQAPRLENAASEVYGHVNAYFAARDWVAMTELLADDVSTEDRRRVVNSGLRKGRNAVCAEISGFAEIGVTEVTSDIIATRGGYLALSRARSWGHDHRPEGFHAEVLHVIEIDAHERIAAILAFDLDDIDAAFKELDARYLAGEAAAHSQTWSVIAANYATVNRREVPPTTPDWRIVDHRPIGTFEASDLAAFLDATWALTVQASIYIEAVHRLSDLGAVVTHSSHATSQEDLDVEWRDINLVTVDGDLVDSCEIFDEADLDAAIARFEQLSRPAPRLENTASRMVEQFLAHFAVRDWDAMAELLADDFSSDDRRRVVNAGIRRGRDVEMANWRATGDIWMTSARSTVVATRGERLVLFRIAFLSEDPPTEAFQAAALTIVEINADNQGAANVVFDIDDVDAAFEELDARYLAGEAAAHSQTWSVIAKACAALNQRELLPTTPDWVNIDHRQGIAFAPGDLTAYIRSAWNLLSDGGVYIETAHRLNDLGAVVTWTGHATSQEGSPVEFRGINVLTVRDDLISRCEIFDESDLDAALAKFEQLSRPEQQLENTASQVTQRFLARFAAGDWDTVTETLADDFFQDDRRRVVGAGVRQGRDAEIVDLRAIADHGITELTSTVMATRGERLVLVRCRFAFGDQGQEAFHAELLGVAEINADERIIAAISFDLDAIDAAFEELDARYRAGEAATHAHTWSVITDTYRAVNRRQLPPMTADFVFTDHLPLQRVEAGDLTAIIRAMRELTPDISQYIGAVHRLSNLGAVVTRMASGTSQEGFDAEWRQVDLFTVEGDKVNRCEVFAEADLDAALGRFEELHPQAPRLENAATLVAERFLAHFAAGDWDAMPEMMADNFSSDDRRRVVGAGVRHGRNAQIMDMRTIADLGITNWAMTHIATRGGRLALSRTRMSGRDQGPEAFYGEMLDVLEINADAQIVAYVVFDLDDIDAAFEELDARYLAGEAAAHSHTPGRSSRGPTPQ